MELHLVPQILSYTDGHIVTIKSCYQDSTTIGNVRAIESHLLPLPTDCHANDIVTQVTRVLGLRADSESISDSGRFL